MSDLLWWVSLHHHFNIWERNWPSSSRAAHPADNDLHNWSILKHCVDGTIIVLTLAVEIHLFLMDSQEVKKSSWKPLRILRCHQILCSTQNFTQNVSQSFHSSQLVEQKTYTRFKSLERNQSDYPDTQASHQLTGSSALGVMVEMFPKTYLISSACWGKISKVDLKLFSPFFFWSGGLLCHPECGD